MDHHIDVDPISQTRKITKIQLSVPQFLFNATEMDVYVTMYTEDMQFVNSQLVHIPPDIYKNWGTDDNYIINYVLQQIQIALSPQTSTTTPVTT